MFSPAVHTEASFEEEDGTRGSSHSRDWPRLSSAYAASCFYQYGYQDSARAPHVSSASSSPRHLRHDLAVMDQNEEDDGNDNVGLSELGALSVQRSSPIIGQWRESQGSFSKAAPGESPHGEKLSRCDTDGASLLVSAVNAKRTKGKRKLREPRFCFKTMSDVDVLDDGYKWRKYGQKVVKNTQHPRSYYRCTQDKCRVKKRVERLAEDPRMVITTYEGRHIHSPCVDGDEPDSSSQISFFC